MRRAVLALVLLWLGVTLVPWHLGRRAEQAYQEALARLDAAGAFRVESQRYERGFFRSHAVTVLAAPTPGAGLDPGVDLSGFAEDASDPVEARLVLRHELEHGPFPLSWLLADEFDGSPILARATTTPSFELVSEEEIEEIVLPVTLESLFTRDDGATFWLLPDPERIDARDPEIDADWDDVYAEAWLAYDGSAFSGEIEVPRLVFAGEAGSLAIFELLYEFEYDRVAGAPPGAPLYAGGSRFRLGRLVASGGDETFELHDLELEDASDVASGTWSMQVKSSLGRFRSSVGGFGPAELHLRMAGLALAPLAELAALGRSAPGEGVPEEAADVDVANAVGVLWPKLMAAGPEIELSRFRLVTPEGEIRMALRLGVDASEPALLGHPLMTLPALELDAELAVPEPVLNGWLATPRPVVGALAEPAPWVAPAELASRRVETWLERGYIERHAGSYLISARMRHGAVRMNGRVVSLDAL